jgi:hypothetical protein
MTPSSGQAYSPPTVGRKPGTKALWVAWHAIPAARFARPFGPKQVRYGLRSYATSELSGDKEMKIKSLIIAAVCAMFVVSATATVFAQGATPAPAPAEKKEMPKKEKKMKKAKKAKADKMAPAPAAAPAAPAK